MLRMLEEGNLAEGYESSDRVKQVLEISRKNDPAARQKKSRAVLGMEETARE